MSGSAIGAFVSFAALVGSALVFAVLIVLMVWDVLFRPGSDDFPLPWRKNK